MASVFYAAYATIYSLKQTIDGESRYDNANYKCWESIEKFAERWSSRSDDKGE